MGKQCGWVDNLTSRSAVNPTLHHDRLPTLPISTAHIDQLANHETSSSVSLTLQHLRSVVVDRWARSLIQCRLHVLRPSRHTPFCSSNSSTALWFCTTEHESASWCRITKMNPNQIMHFHKHKTGRMESHQNERPDDVTIQKWNLPHTSSCCNNSTHGKAISREETCCTKLRFFVTVLKWLPISSNQWELCRSVRFP